MKKKIIAVLLGVSLAAAMAAGCGSKKTDSSQTPQEQTSDAEQNEDVQTGDDNTAENAGDTEDSEVTQDAQTTQEDGQQTVDDAKSENEAGGDAKQDNAATNASGITTVLDSIRTAVPGTAGSSLKSLVAAVDLLDWIMDQGDGSADAQITDAAAEWAKSQLADGDTQEDLLDALAAVQSQAMLYQAAPESMEEQLEDADVKPGHDDYSSADVSGVCDAIREGIQAAE